VRHVEVFVAAFVAGLLTGAFNATADEWPQRPITWILPVPPGGAVDMSARVLQDGLAAELGQPIVIESRVGGATRVAAEGVKRAAPDGYTFGMVGVAFVSNPSLLDRVNYDPVKDYEHTSFIWMAPSVILVHPSQGYQRLHDLLVAAKERPGVIAYATPGVGTSMHTAGEALKLAAKVDLTHVVYRGAGPALTDAIAGHVPVAVINIASAAPLVKEGKLRALAVTSANRSPLLPDVPTVAESGFPGYVITEWQGLVAPATTKASIIERMNAAIRTVVSQPGVAARFREMGFEYLPFSSSEFKKYVADEQKKFADIIRQANIKPIN
jgi:tripartite-type tricarboxylate transporter receptor subunit TctC